jgi:hypothetical protein
MLEKVVLKKILNGADVTPWVFLGQGKDGSGNAPLDDRA